MESDNTDTEQKILFMKKKKQFHILKLQSLKNDVNNNYFNLKRHEIKLALMKNSKYIISTRRN